MAQSKYDQKEGVLKHPADGEAWKDFDNRYPSFAQDPRNVRIGLATDGFNPFGNMSNSYSMWPVILIPYNLPPWKCMKEPFFMMSLLIPGPQAPGRDIDVYLRPLIDELKELWDTGVETYDASSEKSFRMHAAVLWTINDFPAYANLSGWSTKGYLACPVCNEDAPSIKLRSKICYMGHRRYLSPDHKWRRSNLHNGKHDYRSPPKKFTGDELLSQMNNIKTNPGKHPDIYDKNRKRCPDELNWVKKSIFYELPYWKDHLIRHKLDVMHIEKNICDNIVGTLMNIEGKTKDTMKARLDLEDMNIKKELHLKRVGNKFIKRPACYTLSPDQRRDFCKFLKSVKFPDGYAANISRSVNVNEGKISGLKSHDCHVLLQRLLPVGIRPYLKKDLCTPLIELCNFFHDLCAKTLTVAHLDELEKAIPLILCKLERIYPPAFFDVMVHLAVHLPQEAKLVGPVGYSWMYPIERALGTLKCYVKNKARPEGSIAEAYIVNESLTFCSMHFRGTETKFTRPERNPDRSNNNQRKRGSISVFAHDICPTGAYDINELSLQERDQMIWFVLNNCDEVQPYMQEHLTLLKKENNVNVLQRHQKQFPEWFKDRMTTLWAKKSPEATQELYSLAWGFDFRANSYSVCNVNGVRFHTSQREVRRTTQNSGLVVDSEHDGSAMEFYGTVSDVIELEYTLGSRCVI
ncbi:uncharacterized protein LOC113275507 [Papaver somniferum]|uniref:uncharacterized protein LOC113275507 n=1 Tax=Papaver somniferum TaxID=3469 RepID=UPI000E6FB7EE|nr:uncharacterized protein LOC113275507 [Papaver somniferum]